MRAFDASGMSVLSNPPSVRQCINLPFNLQSNASARTRASNIVSAPSARGPRLEESTRPRASLGARELFQLIDANVTCGRAQRMTSPAAIGCDAHTYQVVGVLASRRLSIPVTFLRHRDTPRADNVSHRAEEAPDTEAAARDTTEVQAVHVCVPYRAHLLITS